MEKNVAKMSESTPQSMSRNIGAIIKNNEGGLAG
jgi:hypothetical protein